jgi:hypothetical protein
MGRTRAIFIATAVLSVGACAQVETSEPTAELPTAEQVKWPVGTEVVYQEDDDHVTWTVTSRKNSNVTVSGSNGCSFTTPNGNSYAPSISWSDCGGSTGSREIVSKTGSLWPLKAGNTASWQVQGQDNQNSWSTTRRCEVEGTVNITVPAGTFNAYEVVCRDDWNTRTWYYSPKRKVNVFSQRVHDRRGLQRRSELVEGPIPPTS